VGERASTGSGGGGCGMDFEGVIGRFEEERGRVGRFNENLELSGGEESYSALPSSAIPNSFAAFVFNAPSA